MDSVSSISPSIVLPPTTPLLYNHHRRRKFSVSPPTPHRLPSLLPISHYREPSGRKFVEISCKSRAGDENDGVDKGKDEYEREEEEVERALRMEGGIPGTSNEFVERVSSRAYNMRRSLQQTVESSSYDVLETNPWRETSKPVYVLTHRKNQLCTMKTRTNRSEVERELGLLFSKAENQMLVEDVREGVLGLIKEGVVEPTVAVHGIDGSHVEEDQLSQAPQGPEYVPLLDRHSYEKSFDISDDDPISLANKTTVDYDSNDGDLVSANPLIKYVDFVRHKKKRQSFKGKRRKPNRSYNPLIDVMVSRNISRRLNLGSKKSSDGPTPLSLEEEDSRFGLSRLIKQARESIQQTAKLGVKFYGRESYNIKKFLELNGVFISEQDIVALGEVEVDDSLSLEF